MTAADDNRIVKRLEQILREVDDLGTVTVKMVRSQLEKEFSIDLSGSEERRNFVKTNLQRILEEVTEEKRDPGQQKRELGENANANDGKKDAQDGHDGVDADDNKDEDEDDGDDAGDDDDDDEGDALVARRMQAEEEAQNARPKRRAAIVVEQKRAKKQKREEKFQAAKNDPSKPKKPPKKVVLSPALADVVGGDRMARGDVTKALWAYIKANNLQNPDDGREIVCDDKLMKVFNKKKVKAFGMAADLQKHMAKPEELA